MKKFFKIIVFFIPLFLISQTDSLQKEEYNFRKTIWGMTKQTVKISEKKEPNVEDKNLFAYVDTVMGLKMGVFYYFVDDKLVRAGYSILEKHSNENLYIEDYEKIKNALIEKYGAPSDKWIDGKKYKEIVWSNDLYKNDPSHWGFAISIGHLAYQLLWITEETEIRISLTGDNYKVKLYLYYTSIKLKNLSEKEDTKEKLKNF